MHNWQRTAELALAATVGISAAAWVAFRFTLPSYVRRTCIELAEARGVALDIASVNVSLQTLTLLGVRATLPEVPDTYATAAGIDVAMSGLTPQRVTGRGVELAIHGRLGSVAEGFARWLGSPRVVQNGKGTLETVAIDDAKVVWDGALGDATVARVTGAHLDIAWPGRGTVVRGRSTELTVASPAGTFGPWGYDFEQAPGSMRARATLDPGLPDASTLLVLGDGSSIATIDVAIPREPLSRLGVPTAWLGSSKGVSTAVALHFSKSRGGGRADLTTKGGLFGLPAAGLERPIDVRWEGAMTGDSRSGIDVRGVTLALGPLVGDVRGKLTTYGDGFAMDLTWRATPVPCAALSLPLGSGEVSEIVYQLRKFGISAGRLPGGAVGASATLTFDSRDVRATTASFKPEVTCRIPRLEVP